MKYTKALVLTLATSLAGLANAGGTQSWSNVSDVLAIGLPLVAAGKALTSGDNEGVKELTYSLGTTLVAAETLKALIHEKRPDGSGNDSFPSGHTAIAFAAARFMDKRYAPEAYPFLYAAAGQHHTAFDGFNQLRRIAMTRVVGTARVGDANDGALERRIGEPRTLDKRFAQKQ